MVPLCSSRISRVPPYSSSVLGLRFRVRGYHPLWPDFPDCSTNTLQLTPTGLFPFRSPLLRESRLISFPLATEMFHFTRSSAHSLCIQLRLRLLQTVVTLFGDPRVITLDHSSPRLIAVLYVLLRTFHLGIHHVPLSTSKTKTSCLGLKARHQP